jgi:hypothetical protein
MTPSPTTITSGHPVDECMRIVTNKRIRHLPVVDEGELKGVLDRRFGEGDYFVTSVHNRSTAYLRRGRLMTQSGLYLVGPWIAKPDIWAQKSSGKADTLVQYR